ncbi:MAG: HAD family hydrolase, partial [Eggerthella lenta]
MPATGTESASAQMQGAPESKARLAVFDFDGTSIAGNSPVLLVSHLLSRKMLKKRVVFRILLWAAAYKLRLPQNEAAVRGLVFTAFEGKPAAEVDAFLAEFYDERIAPLFRPEADAAMRAHAEAGDTVVVISATFEPIILRAMEH